MKFLNLASNKSFCRGFDYHRDNRVIEWKQIEKGRYTGKVKGRDDHIYDVIIDIEHPRKSACNCPFAEGRRVVCKHMVALYLSIFPEKEKEIMEYIEEEEAEYYNELEQYEEEQVSYLEILKEDITNYVNGLSEQEVRELLINRMLVDIYDGEWEESSVK